MKPPSGTMSPRFKKGVPDLNKCQAKLAGFGDYVDCLVAQPERCVYALVFGNGHLCRHADRQAIALKTAAASAPHQL
jgi:hypothetical protein